MITGKRRNSRAESSQQPPDRDLCCPEAAARVLVYIGTPSNRLGNEGDFYLEEETNVLFGPKTNGAWPEDGVKVSGHQMRKRKRELQPAWSIDQSQLRPTTMTPNKLVIYFCKLLKAVLELKLWKNNPLLKL